MVGGANQRLRLTRNRRFIDDRGAGKDHSVGKDRFAGFDDDNIARPQFGGCDRLELEVAHFDRQQRLLTVFAKSVRLGSLPIIHDSIGPMAAGVRRRVGR